MKAHRLFAVCLLTVFGACTEQPVTDFKDPLDDGNPVAVRFGASAGTNITVKSAGTVGAADNYWNGESLRIYGFERNVTDFTTTPFIDNVEATAPVNAEKGGIEVLNPAYGEPYFYVAGKFYDFYGYHIDDAANGNPTAETGRIYIPFSIDGSQDLMIAKADQASDIAAANAGNSVAEANAYSAFAARRGVQPNLLFKHQLARFTFEIVAGSEPGSLISVDKITIDSKYSGNLAVAGNNRGLADISDEVAPLTLKEKGADGQMQDLSPVKPEAYTENRINVKSVGESLMVIPGESTYKLSVYTSKEGSQTVIDPQEWTLDIKNIQGAPEGATTFEAGYTYKVRIVIYGLEEVEITAELEAWKDGGSTTIDPDIV